jgi:hypothetical protein
MLFRTAGVPPAHEARETRAVRKRMRTRLVTHVSYVGTYDGPRPFRSAP